MGCTRCDEPLNVGRDGIADPSMPDRQMHWHHAGIDPEQCHARFCIARAWSNGWCGPHNGNAPAETRGAYS